MNVKCLTSNEVKLLLAYIVEQPGCNEKEFTKVFEASKAWESWIVCLSLFVARHIDADIGGLEKIARIYALQEEIAIELQEGGDAFIEYLLRHLRLPNETLDDALIVNQEGFSKHDYEQALRY